MILPAFLLSVAIISLTGVLMPGPVFVAAVAKGAESKHAGAWIALGHFLVEVPLILAIAAGFSYIFDQNWVAILIGIAGGGILLFMGGQMFINRDIPDAEKKAFPMHPILAGILTTVSNPYFILWWLTVGALLTMRSLEYGAIGLIGFIVVHEFCDLGWEYLVSYSVNTSKRLWNQRIRQWVFGICGVVMAGFGLYFIFSVAV